ncbi:hypothetical protein NDU88_004705 [Pleurodeles waltl]|uniref:Uncharacterized protein n=1 Tax=Pleurodeles waltl TaxID=8319 RepID=A0AAV7MZ66_PLEWA|nr:hypothetical protein NDU88_004705 [Pleurodeles waltl]
MQTQIAAMAVDVILLRADLRVVAECSVATENQVTCLQSEMGTLKASVAILEAKTHKLEVRVEDAKAYHQVMLPEESQQCYTQRHFKILKNAVLSGICCGGVPKVDESSIVWFERDDGVLGRNTSLW